jgi:enoyl-CoA hydratase
MTDVTTDAAADETDEAADTMPYEYDLPDVLQVEADGPIRVVRLNRPDQLNATNHELHGALADVFPQLDADPGARAAVITGNGRAFSAGGDFNYIDELTKDDALRKQTLVDGKRIVTGMAACRVPIVAAVNGPAVGLGCSIVALSDIVYMAESAHLADPHVLVGLVAADGGPVVWPLLTSLQLAKEYALTGDRIPARRAGEIGLANHVCPDGEVIDQAMACARRIAKLPQRATEDTKRILNLHLERAVLAALDFALTAEDRSFVSPELRTNLDRLLSRDTRDSGDA